MFQIEALKAAGVTEVVLAINYQPEVRRIIADASSRNIVLAKASRVFLWLKFLYFDFGNTSYFRLC
jgi:NDP-sugar pyrophosphorylase family protein